MLDKPFRRAVIAAGLDPAQVTPHVMRHTAITNLVKAGVDLPTIQKISGHRTLVMVLRYVHVHGHHIDQAIQTIGRGVPKHPGNTKVKIGRKSEPLANKPTDTATPKLHSPVSRPV